MACESIFSRINLDARPQHLHTFLKVNSKYIQCTCPVGQAKFSFHLPSAIIYKFYLAGATGKAPMSSPVGVMSYFGHAVANISMSC